MFVEQGILVDYSCSTCCNFKGRGEEVFSLHHDADVLVLGLFICEFSFSQSCKLFCFLVLIFLHLIKTSHLLTISHVASFNLEKNFVQNFNPLII